MLIMEIRLKPYERLFETNPLLRLVLPLIAGIALAGFFERELQGSIPIMWVGFLLFFSVAFFVFRSTLPHRRKYIPFFASVSVCMAALGVVLYLSDVERNRMEWKAVPDYYYVRVVSSPKQTSGTWRFTAVVEKGEGAGHRVQVVLEKRHKGGGRQKAAMLENAEQERLHPGDVLLMHAQIKSPDNPGNPMEFDYAGWLRRQGISGTAFCSATHWKRAAAQFGPPDWRTKALLLRDRLVRHYSSYMEGQSLAVLSAMTLGDKTYLDTDTRDRYSRTGVSHILALSGLHLSILFFFYQQLVLPLFRRRRQKIAASVLGIAGLWGFALLAGLPVSLIRATIMYSLVQLLSCCRHDVFSINNLSLAAGLILFVSPQALFDVGFQLSFLSCLSILLFSGSFRCPSWMRRWWLLRSLYSLLVVSFCAQLGTFPLVAYYFHQIPLWGLVSNLVAVPLAYILLGLSVLFIAVPPLRSLLAGMLDFLLETLNHFLGILSELPGGVWEVFPVWQTIVLIYLAMYFMIRYCTSRWVGGLYAAAVSLAGVLVLEEMVLPARRHTPSLLFYNKYPVPAVHLLVSDSEAYLWSTDCVKAEMALADVRRVYWKSNGWTAPSRLDTAVSRGALYYDGWIMDFYGCRVAFCCRRLPLGKPDAPLPVDYLFLTRGIWADLSELLEYFRPRTILLDANLPRSAYLKYKEEVRKWGGKSHDLREQGALEVRLGAGAKQEVYWKPAVAAQK